METKQTLQGIEKLAERYALFIMEDSVMPVTEIEWLVEQLLDSKHREDIINLLETFKD